MAGNRDVRELMMSTLSVGSAELPVDDQALAAILAEAAGAELLALRDEIGFGDPRLLRDTGDRRAQALLAQRLAAARPDDAVLSEEAVDDGSRATASRVWIIDPLDGTREFSEQGRTDWAVHVALWEHGGLTAGAVALPARAMTLSTAAPPPLPTRQPGRIRVVVSRTRAPAIAEQVAAGLDAELVPMGSVGAKVAAVIAGDVDCYLHAGGQYEWDSAAPVAVARAAGLYASRLDGSDLSYNRPNPYLPDLLVCAPQLAPLILRLIAAGDIT